MRKIVDDILDIIILIVTLALMSPVMISQSIPLFRGDLGGFNDQIEKTALHTDSTLHPLARTFTTEDTMLMLAVQDEYCPQPKSVEIDVDTPTGPDISIDQNYVAYKESGLSTAYGAMQTGLSNVNMNLYVGPNGLRKWVVSK